MQAKEIYDFLVESKKTYPGLIHASNYIAKNKSKLKELQRSVLDELVQVYYSYLKKNLSITGCSDQDVRERVKEVNKYYNYIHSHSYDYFFTSQSKFRPTILEEFCYILFKDVVDSVNKKLSPHKIESGAAKAYTNLYFAATNLEEFVKSPEIGVNEKDQDFAIYKTLELNIADKKQSIKLPVIAAECKTYIDKTMLEGSIATAEKIKSGNPYSLFFIITEAYDVSLDVDPAYSRIDQIYVLRKCTQKSLDNEWRVIDEDVVIDFVREVKNHLSREWSNVKEKMAKEGKII